MGTKDDGKLRTNETGCKLKVLSNEKQNFLYTFHISFNFFFSVLVYVNATFIHLFQRLMQHF